MQYSARVSTSVKSSRASVTLTVRRVSSTQHSLNILQNDCSLEPHKEEPRKKRIIARYRKPHVSLKGGNGLPELSEDSAGLFSRGPEIPLIDTIIIRDATMRKLWGTHRLRYPGESADPVMNLQLAMHNTTRKALAAICLIFAERLPSRRCP